MFVPILFPQPSQDHYHWLLLVGVTAWVPQSYVNYCLILTFPQAPDEDVTLCLQSAPPLTYLLL